MTRGAPTGLPKDWHQLWGEPASADQKREMAKLSAASARLARAVPLLDSTELYRDLVGSAHLSNAPVHRWFPYREGYSPNLLGTVVDDLRLGEGLRVVDAFGGVGTTALSGAFDRRVTEVRSVEYSPLAHFVGATKLGALALKPDRLRDLERLALAYPIHGEVSAPTLRSFSDKRIFSAPRLSALLRARDHVAGLPGASPLERHFFLLGLAAVVEDLSGVMKDGRALRIVGSRNRRPTSLARQLDGRADRSPVKAALHSQWTSMIEDLEEPRSSNITPAGYLHMRGDARHLHSLQIKDECAFPDGWADLSCFSPPYLNFIDYSEVHKLELWLLGFVQSKEEFRTLREGTLRSHPSIRFEDTESPLSGYDELKTYIDALEEWMAQYARRKGDSAILRQYFEDMYVVFEEQYRVIRPGGRFVCVVANSTFSRRSLGEDRQTAEDWRLPVLTDVLLAHIALAIGFVDVHLLKARDLRPRNVSRGRARESLIVGSRP